MRDNRNEQIWKQNNVSVSEMSDKKLMLLINFADTSVLNLKIKVTKYLHSTICFMRGLLGIGSSIKRS